jgi:hypothetical protein
MVWERGSAAPTMWRCERRRRRYRRTAGGRRRGLARGRVGWLGLPGRSGPGGLAWPAWPFGAGWLARPAWPFGAGWAGSATGPVVPKVEEDFFSDKIEFLNLPRLWKFVEGDLGGILRWGFILNSSWLLKDFRKI